MGGEQGSGYPAHFFLNYSKSKLYYYHTKIRKVVND